MWRLEVSGYKRNPFENSAAYFLIFTALQPRGWSFPLIRATTPCIGKYRYKIIFSHVPEIFPAFFIPITQTGQVI